MRLLLDSQALFWWLLGHANLSSHAAEAIAASENDVYVSPVSGYEILFKHKIGKLPVVIPEELSMWIRRSQFLELPITFAHAQAAARLPLPHRDPWDRMLMAQSIVEDMPVVTCDKVFENYGIQVIW